MKLIIIGGGISGLSSAYYALKRFPHASITILEAANRTGGWIRSNKRPPGYIFEQGPRTIRPGGLAGTNTLQLIEEIGIANKIIPIGRSHPAAKNRMLYVNDNLYTLPNDLLGLVTKRPPFSKPLIMSLFHEMRAPVKLSDDESMYDFVERRFGKEIADYGVGALVRGVCAGDAKEISVKFLMKRLFEYEQTHGGIVRGMLRNMITPSSKTKPFGLLEKRVHNEKWSVYSFDGGVETLANGIRTFLEKRDVTILTDVTCVEIENQSKNSLNIIKSDKSSICTDRVIVALPSSKAAQLFKKSNRMLSNELSSIESATVGIANLHYFGNVLKQKAFGFLVPPTEDSSVLGVTFDSCCIPNATGDTVLTVMMGGRHFKKFFGSYPPQEQLLKTAIETVQKILNIKQTPNDVDIAILHDCIPQYVVGHEARIQRIEKLIGNQGIMALCGASYYGVGVNDVIVSAKRAVQNIGFVS